MSSPISPALTATSSSSASAARWGRRWRAWPARGARTSASSRVARFSDAGLRDSLAVARHRDDRLRPARSARGGGAADASKNVIFMAGFKFGADAATVADLGDERAVPAMVAETFTASPHRRLLDRLRLSVRRRRRRRRRRGHRSTPPGEYANLLPRPRAHVRVPLRAQRHARPAVPAELRDRSALRRAARHRREGAATASRSTSRWAMST